VLSEPTSVMTDLLGHAVGQTWLILAILAQVDVSQPAGGTLGPSHSESNLGMTDLLGHAVGQTRVILTILTNVGVWQGIRIWKCITVFILSYLSLIVGGSWYLDSIYIYGLLTDSLQFYLTYKFNAKIKIININCENNLYIVPILFWSVWLCHWYIFYLQ
jgi:hypothetical protein